MFCSRTIREKAQRKETRVYDFIVAYSHRNYGLTMKEIDGGDSTHKRLMIQLSRKLEWL